MKISDKALRLLKVKLKELQSEVKTKDRIIQEYERDWSLKLFGDLQAITQEYSVLLKPPPITLKASFKNQGYSFRIELSNIIGLFSKGRTKVILLEKLIPSFGSHELITDVIYTEMGFPELLNQLDRSKFHFCQVNRSCYVNLKYYNLRNVQVVTDKIKNKSFEKYSTIKISQKHETEFISKKNDYHHISSLQKDQLHYILKFIIGGMNSFSENKNHGKRNK